VDPLNSGFKWYHPEISRVTEYHRVGGHEWTITGHDMQVLTCTVPHGETFTTEVGSFMFMHPDMETEVELTCCSKAGGGCSRILGGESCVKVNLINEGVSEGGYVGVTPNFPAKIIPIQFGQDIKAGSSLIGKGGVFMSQLGDVDVGYNVDCNFLRCCCGGLGACRQKLSGDGLAFLAAGGTIVEKELGPDEIIFVDGGSIVAHEDTVKLGLAPSGAFCMCCLGGEGCFFTKLMGPGKVWLQSMSFERFRSQIQVTVTEDMDRDGADKSE